MTTAIKAVSPALPMGFTAAANIYRLSPDACEIDIIDQLHARQTQLDAMLALTFGEAGKHFREMNEVRQDIYMGACASAANEIQQLTGVLASIRGTAGRGAA